MTSIAQERSLRGSVGLQVRTREQWGSQYNYTNSRPVDEPATRLFFHITITNPSSYSSNDAHARAVESIGISRFPATGLSYNALILPGGHLYEGQPFGRRGAHTVNDHQRSNCSTSGCPSRGSSLTAPSWNLNVNARAIALARNTDDPVTNADIDAAARWGAAHKLCGLVHADARWHGHRCVSSKACPGDLAWARMDDLTDLTADYVRNGLENDMTPEQAQSLADIESLVRNIGGFAQRVENTDFIHREVWAEGAGKNVSAAVGRLDSALQTNTTRHSELLGAVDGVKVAAGEAAAAGAHAGIATVFTPEFVDGLAQSIGQQVPTADIEVIKTVIAAELGRLKLTQEQPA